MDIVKAIERMEHLVFTTREIAAVTNSSLSSAVQKLDRLAEREYIGKIKQGVWGKIYDRRFSPFLVIPYLAHQSYLSFISALHIHGVISQIPQDITVAGTAHGRKVVTPVGVYVFHQLAPEFFCGFEWSQNGAYLIATPEKALVDCLYISSRKGRKFSFFPEIDFSSGFDIKKADEWAEKIRDARIRKQVTEKLHRLFHE